ncbi:MAG: AAA family ATPase [Bacilli bacterium]|nr:AAA family ATPase [Bacilli bacterium]
MDSMKTYGIVFRVSKIDDKNVWLRASYLVEGTVNSNGDIVDKYEKIYKSISSSSDLDSNEEYFGFGVSQSDLQGFFKEKGYPQSQALKPEVCANFYFEFARRYVFILEKGSNGNYDLCYSVNLYTKNCKEVELDKNIMRQLIDELLASRDNISPNSNLAVLDSNTNPYDPKELLKKVKKRVVGQDEAAFQLISTVCKNLKYSRIEGMKTNVLLYGPTGCGKTELVRSLAKEMDLPLVIEDVTNYTANGYVGDSVKSILRRLYVVSNNDMGLAERGIIFLDEFDKLASPSSGKTVNKTEVQEELLKIVEGVKINLNDTNKTTEQLMMDTSNITFILGGAFTELLEEKKKKTSVIGFTSCEQEQTNDQDVVELTNEDFVKYGIIPEMVGRVPIKIPIRQLGPKDLEKVLTTSSISCLTLYETALLSTDKVTVVYEDKGKFISKVALEADALHAGARGLKTIVDKVFLPVVSRISTTEPYRRELLLSPATVENPNEFVLKKVKREKNELSKGTGKTNQSYRQG